MATVGRSGGMLAAALAALVALSPGCDDGSGGGGATGVRTGVKAKAPGPGGGLVGGVETGATSSASTSPRPSGAAAGGVEATATPTATGSPTPVPTIASPTPEAFKAATFTITRAGKLAADAAGNLWISSVNQGSATAVGDLFKVEPASGSILASASGIPVVARAIATQASTAVFVTDGSKVQKYASAGTAVGSPTSALAATTLNAGIAMDNSANRVWVLAGDTVITLNGGTMATATTCDFKAGTKTGAVSGGTPAAIALDASGNAWVAGGSYWARLNGSTPGTIAASGSVSEVLADIRAIAVVGTALWLGQPNVALLKLNTADLTAVPAQLLVGTGAEAFASDGSKLLAYVNTPSGAAEVNTFTAAGAADKAYTVRSGISGATFAAGSYWYTVTSQNQLIKANF
jgi:hypothetical protein